MTDLHRELEQRARIWGRVLANEWQAELRRTNPIDTGNMRDHTTARDQPTATSVQVTATVDTEYAEMVSSGTRPHVIRARPGGTLRFQWHGHTVYFKQVNHPGTRPELLVDRLAPESE